MPTWVTHLMVADRLLQLCPTLDRRGFCVGSIAPDCNIENEDWTVFTPPRQVTHWMYGSEKTVEGAEEFYRIYVSERRARIKSAQEYSFLLGYYVHLVTDAMHVGFLRDESRLKDAWKRIKSDKTLHMQAASCLEDWETLKRIISRQERMREISFLEAQYLKIHPDSGYLTEIVPLEEFPDYIDYLPPGGIVRKIRVMGTIPEVDPGTVRLLVISEEELYSFVERVAVLTAEVLEAKAL